MILATSIPTPAPAPAPEPAACAAFRKGCKGVSESPLIPKTPLVPEYYEMVGMPGPFNVFGDEDDIEVTEMADDHPDLPSILGYAARCNSVWGDSATLINEYDYWQYTGLFQHLYNELLDRQYHPQNHTIKKEPPYFQLFKQANHFLVEYYANSNRGLISARGELTLDTVKRLRYLCLVRLHDQPLHDALYSIIACCPDPPRDSSIPATYTALMDQVLARITKALN